MRSEDDIREALEALAETAPDADDVLARVRARERGERRTALHTPVLVGMSAVATAAAAFAVPLAFDLPEEDMPVAEAPASTPARVNPRWQRYFTLSLPAGYKLESQVITPLYQIATVRGPSVKWCEVMVYDWRNFDPKLVPAKRTKVRLHDVTGYAATFDDPRSSVPGRQPRIAWEWSLEMWATAACRGGSTDQVMTVARAVRHSGTGRMLMPFRIGYLPAGVSVYSASSLNAWNSVRAMAAISGPAVNLAAAKNVVTTQTASGNVVTKGIPKLVIEFRKGNSTPPGAASMSVAGRPARMTRSGLLIHLDGHEVEIAGVGPVSTSRGELVKIAEAMTFAPDLTDESTWFDGTVAIP